MADEREPPPLFDDDETVEKDQDSDDLFASATETKKEPEKKADAPKEDEDKDDIFADAEDFSKEVSEVPLDDTPETEKVTEPKSEPASLPTSTEDGKSESAKTDASESMVASSIKASAPVDDRTKEEMEEEESGDQFSIEISVTDPKKIGDGMGSYMTYKVNTKTTIPQFKKPELSVYRRFSDFLGIHDKLAEKHLPEGRIIPPPPEKSVLGMTKIKMSKEEAGSHDFVEKRRAALERYLSRTAKHPVLRLDSDFRDFLELDGDLPKATSTSALSGAGVMRLFSKMGDSIGKMTFKMDETDQWFEEKQQQVESLDQQLRKLHSSIEGLVMYRRELAFNTGSFAKSAAMLGNAEENTALSRALSQLAEVEEKIDQLHLDQADSDFFVFAELTKDYISLIQSVKDVFTQRVKMFKMWKDAEAMLSKKRENKAKLELARKTDKIPQAEAEIKEWIEKVEKGQQDFEAISKTIRKELARFELQRVKDFKNTIINYLESLMNSQQQLIKYWEAFLPEAKAIA